MLNTNDTLVIGIDIQEKLVNMLKNSETIATNATKLLSACNILNIQTNQKKLVFLYSQKWINIMKNQ